MSQQSVLEAYRRKLASNPEGQIDYTTVEITHPRLSKRYLLVRGTEPLTATLETGETVTFEPTALEAKGAANNNDMDQRASFTLPDVDNQLDDELDRIDPADPTLPKVTYRRFISTDLSYPADGPVVYELQSVSQEKGLFTIDTGVPMLNQKGTGLLMTPSDIPLLRGILST